MWLSFNFMKIVAVLNRMENSKEIDEYYLNAIKLYGGVPLLINEYNLDLLKICGGILLTGGDNKGKLDDYLIKYALDNNLALLGICQGMQSMALYKTDNKLSDVENHYKKNHQVILNNSNLKSIINEKTIYVNSFHHSMVTSSKIFDIVGLSDDGIIEAIENNNHLFQIGVEWHPERMIEEKSSQNIFKEFIKNINESIDE